MKKIIAYSFLVIFMLGCKQFNKPDAPENLISEQDMVSILVDLSVLSSAKGVNRKILENKGISPEQYVYKTHDIDSLQFLNSNSYYAYNTDIYNTIIERVEDSLNKLKVTYNKRIEEADTKILNAKNPQTSAIVKDSVSKDSVRKKAIRIE